MSAPDKKDWDKLLKDMLDNTARPDKSGFYALDNGYKRTPDQNNSLSQTSVDETKVNQTKVEKRERKKRKIDSLSS